MTFSSAPFKVLLGPSGECWALWVQPVWVLGLGQQSQLGAQGPEVPMQEVRANYHQVTAADVS